MSSPFIVHKSGEAPAETSPKKTPAKDHLRVDDSANQGDDVAPEKHSNDDIAQDNKRGGVASFEVQDIDVKQERTKKIQNLFIYLILLPICAIALVVGIEFYLTGDKYMSLPLRTMLAGVGILIFSLVLFRTFSIYRLYENDKKLMKQLFDGSPTARLVSDVRGRIIFENAQFLNLCSDLNVEHKRVDVLLDLFKASGEEAQQDLSRLIDNARKGLGGTLELKLSYGDHPSGQSEALEKWFQIDAQPVPERAGHVQWRLDDVTKRHNVDALIREERAKLLDFMNNAPVGFFSVNEEGRFNFVNETMARWLDETPEQLLSSSKLHSFLVNPPSDAAEYDIASGGGAKQIRETSMMSSKGKKFLASINQAVVHEEEGRVRTRGVIHDLTSERAMDKALKDSEDRFQKFFEEAPLGIVMVDQYGMISVCNSSFARMLDMSVDTLQGVEFGELIDLQYRNMVKNAIDDIKDGQKLLSPIEYQLTKGKKSVFVQMYARKLQEKNIVLHFIDLTDQKSLEAQFAQSQKMQAIGQLAGGVAHDFNNLLTAMIGFCDLLILRHKAGDPSFNDIMQIKQNANRAANLVRQLLAFSRQQTLQSKVLDITETLTELSHLLHRLIGVGIELNVHHDDGLGLVKADEGQLEQVLINLAVNARDAMEGQGKLDIHTYPFENKAQIKRGADNMPAGKWVVVEIKDNGCGIDQENLERIFEPFFTTKEIGSGTGLGLSTVYGIIRQTGGYIHVESVVGKGTNFQIYLPEHVSNQAETVTLEQKESKVEKDLTGTATILLVEDEDAVRGFAARALKNKGYEVLEAACAEDALDLIQDENPHFDMMITDVIMPEKDGPTLAREVLAMRPDLPVVFVSGYTEDRFKDEFAEYDVSFLPKPFTLKQLAERVKDTLDKD